MKEEVLIVILNEFADWESAFIAASLNSGVTPNSQGRYTVKTISINKKPVTSIGGFTVLPDYDLNSVPEKFAALILIGGTQWFQPEAEQIKVLLTKATHIGAVIGGICNASVFLGMNGYLNDVKHTSNTLPYLQQFAKEMYTGQELYIDQQAVRDSKLVTANGSAFLEFNRELLFALNADSDENINANYQFMKKGLCPL